MSTENDCAAGRVPAVLAERSVAVESPPLTVPKPPPDAPPEAMEIPLPRSGGKRPRERTVRLAVLCVLLAVGAGAILLPAIRAAVGDRGGGNAGDLLGGMLMGGGLPPTGGQAAGTEPETERETLTSVILPPEEGPRESGGESQTESENDTYTETDGELETDKLPLPDGAYAVVSRDLSEPDRSVGYIQSTASKLPSSIPGEGERLWSTSAAPTVLLVHTHPYEGYHDGGDWYDPATGPFAQTDASGTSEGVVALGVALSGILREVGVNVIHLRIPVEEGESATALYARTEEAVRYYCELYPEIGLVIDLRRSAELTDGGEILRTQGNYEGEACAQVRLSVDGDRDADTVSRDIAVAVALRRALWAEETSLSRPVLVKSGSGLAGSLDRVVMLTVELGSAGNTFAEAERLLDPLGSAIAALVKAP